MGRIPFVSNIPAIEENWNPPIEVIAKVKDIASDNGYLHSHV